MSADRELPYPTLARHIELLLRADEGLLAAFWDETQPASANYENIAYWLSQSRSDATGE